MAEGVDGLLRDKIRRPGIAPLDAALVDKVAVLTLEPPSHEATHWTVRAMAKAIGVAALSVVKIWHDHGRRPTGWAASSCPTTKLSPRSCMMSSGFMSRRLSTPSCCQSTK